MVVKCAPGKRVVRGCSMPLLLQLYQWPRNWFSSGYLKKGKTILKRKKYCGQNCHNCTLHHILFCLCNITWLLNLIPLVFSRALFFFFGGGGGGVGGRGWGLYVLGCLWVSCDSHLSHPLSFCFICGPPSTPLPPFFFTVICCTQTDSIYKKVGCKKACL